MRRILLLIKGLGRGGAEQLLVSAAPYTDTSRFEYEVAYLLPWKDALTGELRAAGLPLHCLDGGRGTAWVGRLASLVRRRGIDLVHMHSPYAAVPARVVLPSKGVKLVYTEHGVWERYHPATYWANLLTFSRNDHVFAVSHHVQESVRYPAPLRFMRMPPIETLYHGIDLRLVGDPNPADGVREEFGIPDGAPVIGTVANFRALKGHRYLLLAASRVWAVLPEVRFVLVGQGPLEAAMRREAERLALGDRVIFTGFRSDVLRILGMVDVFVLPSLHEGLSIALIEAMALGKPAVVTHVGGLREVVENGLQGLVVPEADPGALARAILEVLGDVRLRERLGEGARRRALDFDIRDAVDRMEQVYEGLLG